MTAQPIDACPHTTLPATAPPDDAADHPTGQDPAGAAPRFRNSPYRGTGTPTAADVADAARTAWANADRCIGRLYWRGLHVRDFRHLTDPDAVATALAEHLRVATRRGAIRSVATVLHPSVEVLSEQLVGYAGYRQTDGSILGDPRHADETDLALRAGWPGGRPTPGGGRLLPGRFDVLPLLLRIGGGPIIAYQLPTDRVLEVELEHPRHPWLAGLGLRWYAVPALARHRLHLNDTLAYPVAFSGWYQGSEIACRDLADTNRYDTLPTLARCLGLDTTGTDTLWIDEAELVLHQAVLHSYGKAGVTITEHHREDDRFGKHIQAEARAGYTVPADRSWVLPPTASARLSVYHQRLPAAPPDLLPAYRPMGPPVT